ncbi:biotin carboxylase N-terminal domain-containing protein [Agrococcus sp. TF02-05]|uniref:acetyl/propionyl/methylcrotonyl-CoA carboxylase subunit alpha n=1 Tax=Agrococcus sp. TF02-05 TaxID=2815211 RepID=UPI001AA0C509|nr:biotin carboxylase N-terminal domain-containing protein [Agrococcus sp. TF02-05]MBO1768598.1 ATP-grasp domain-containing protein [Agrococcus sp. TF02-05]
MASLFDTVLVANRGEIAIRIARTLRDLGIRSVAVRADDDPSPHPEHFDETVSLGSGPLRDTYLSIERILDAARASGAQAIHPGYGFLSENAAFARACEDADIVFIGPSALAIETMGDKISARHAVESRGVATVPGIAEPGLDDSALIAGAERVGYPVLIKPAAGGGGKGMYRVDDPAELPAALQAARREAKSAFGDDTLFIERFVTNPRHIEVQVLADTHGNVIHLGERECSLQRRHQKVIEEAPSALLTEAQRAAIGEAAIETARSVGYVGAGTVEFIVAGDRPDEPFFMEMNTRLQVEHPVTEMVTGIDLVEQQVRIAAGEPLAIAQDDVRLEGHAIEARIYAEDPAAGFLPTGGRVLDVQWPWDDGDYDGMQAPSVRVDAGVGPGTVVGSSYDPMIAKVIAHGATREEAIDRLDRALAETTVLGVTTNRAFLRALLSEPAVRAGELDTGLIDREADRLVATGTPSVAFAAAAAAAGMLALGGAGAWQHDGWRIGGSVGRVSHYRDGDGIATVRVRRAPDRGDAVPYGGGVRQPRLDVDIEVARADGPSERLTAMHAIATSRVPEGAWVGLPEGDFLIERHVRTRSGRAAAEPTLASPMPGTVVAVHASDGDAVEEGQAVVSVEAMKMEHVLRAPVAGTVHVHARVGEQVTRGQELATVTPESQEDA